MNSTTKRLSLESLLVKPTRLTNLGLDRAQQRGFGQVERAESADAGSDRGANLQRDSLLLEWKIGRAHV